MTATPGLTAHLTPAGKLVLNHGDTRLYTERTHPYVVVTHHPSSGRLVVVKGTANETVAVREFGRAKRFDRSTYLLARTGDTYTVERWHAPSTVRAVTL
jgi:hypothetical protein